jgi:peptidoglycan/LPS O-acetylase OafA/YrhL
MKEKPAKKRKQASIPEMTKMPMAPRKNFWFRIKGALFRFAVPLKTIGKRETNIYKGLAILLIVSHNFFRWINPNSGENEFFFSAKHVENFLSLVQKYPWETPNLFFSYFGHYGVQIFIFLSGYGLSKSYLSGNKNFLVFLGNRVLKLYPAFLFSMAILLIINLYRTSSLPNIYYLRLLLIKLSLISNFLPDQALSINGPWWFFSLIFQLYLLFYPLLWLKKIAGNWTLFIFAVMGLIISLHWEPVLNNLGLKSRTLFVAYLPEFCFGIYFAHQKKIEFPLILLLISLAVFFLGNFQRIYWHFSFMAFLFLILPASQFLIKSFGRDFLIFRIFSYFGHISLPLFAIHGVLRDPLLAMANSSRVNEITLFLFLTYLFFSSLLSHSVQALTEEINLKVKKLFLSFRLLRQKIKISQRQT